KMVEPVELQPMASKPSSTDGERGYSLSAASCINPGYTQSSSCIIPGYTHSSKVSRSSNKALINGKTVDANYNYASAFQPTTPTQWSNDIYDNTSDETKPHCDRAYDHIPSHFFEEYDKTYLTIHTKHD
ncbi:hypothetical protein ACJMK2_021270, partial [Sinanodonta woodiana]